MAEALISEAKRALSEEYDNYADVQRWMNKAEDLRMLTTTLLSKHLNGKLLPHGLSALYAEQHPAWQAHDRRDLRAGFGLL